MITRHPEIDEGALADLVGSPEPLEFLPVGADSWSYRSGAMFVSVRDAKGQRKTYTPPRDIARSLRAACVLRDRGLEFILAPDDILPFGRFVVSTYPFLDGEISWGVDDQGAVRDLVRPWIDRLHATTADVDLPREDFVPDYVDGLRAALERIGTNDGPHASQVATLLDPGPVLASLETHLAHGASLRERGTPMVVTHAEPLGNVMLVDDGCAFLVDLGDMKIAPPERDLREFGEGDAEIIAYYGRDYALSEVAEYTDRLTKDHIGDPEDDRAWEELQHWLVEATR